MGPRDDPDDSAGDGPWDHHADWQRSDAESISSAVVRAVAATKDVDPTDIVTPLDEAVDADALVAFLASGSGDGEVSVTFEFAGRVVTARDDGHVTVRRPED